MPAGSKQLVVALVEIVEQLGAGKLVEPEFEARVAFCLLYTSDAADE